jgi:mono/diheme cytochrome c family protein
MKVFVLSMMVLGMLMTVSCSSDSEEDLMPENSECVTEDMSYTDDILPILERNCMSCHNEASQQGGVNLEGYDQLKLWVDNGAFLGSIQGEPGFSPMPQGGPQLPECEIDKVEAWINQGAQNN